MCLTTDEIPKRYVLQFDSKICLASCVPQQFQFVDKCNWELAQRLKDSKQELAGMKTQERVRTAIQWRLEMQIPFMGESFL